MTSRFGVQFVVATVAVLIFKFNTVYDLPMWDSAMGLFPAALELSDNGFNLVEVVSSPGYGQGGPNTHATSIITFVTAAVLALAGSKAFAVLHLIHFALTGLALTYLYRLSQPYLGDRDALALVVATFFFPLVFVQAGRLYFEIPLLLCAVGMLHAHLRGFYWQSVLWASLGFAVKETGIILPAVLAVLLFLEKAPWRTRILRASGSLGFSLVVLALPVALAFRQMTDGTQSYHLFPPLAAVALQSLRHLIRFLFRIPDVLLLLVLFLVSVVRLTPRILSGLLLPPSDATNEVEVVGDRAQTRDSKKLEASIAVLILLFMAMFFVGLPVVTNFTLVLPRYYSLVVPFLLLWASLQLVRSGARRFVLPFLGAFVLVSLINWNGWLYPPDTDTAGPGNDFALTERSMAYRTLNSLQEDAVHHIAELPGEHPIFYGHHEHYLTQYPGLGYVDAPLASGINVHLDPGWRVAATESDCLYALFNYPWLGGAQILFLLDEIGPERGMIHDTVGLFEAGRYAVTVHRLQAQAGSCPG